MRVDARLGKVLIAHGPCGLLDLEERSPFDALVIAIVNQQLSTSAARTITGRLCQLFPDGRLPAPEGWRHVSVEQIRAVGLSRPKATYIKELADRVASGDMPLAGLADLPDEDVIALLTRARGIGRWSAEMVLMFTLRRPDVLPLDDLGIRRAVQRVYRLRKPPTPDRVRRIAAPWRPYRTVACWYLWASLSATPVQSAPVVKTRRRRPTPVIIA